MGIVPALLMSDLNKSFLKISVSLFRLIQSLHAVLNLSYIQDTIKYSETNTGRRSCIGMKVSVGS